MSHLKIFTGVLVIFLSGLAVGAVGGGIAVRKRIIGYITATPEQRATISLKVLDRKLSLNASQESNLKKIITDMNAQLFALRSEARIQYMPTVQSILSRSIAEVKSNLTPLQAEVFDQYIAQKLGAHGISLNKQGQEPVGG